MVTYSPSFLAFTNERRDLEIHVSGTDGLSLSAESLSIVTYIPGKDTLTLDECDISLPHKFLGINKTTTGYAIELKLSDAVSNDLGKCITHKGEILALRLDFSQNRPVSDAVQIGQAAIIPIFDSSQGNTLTRERTPVVLGELFSTLKIDQLSCSNRIIVRREEVICQASVQNVSNYNVFGNILISLREVLPPGTTTYEKVERTNILLVPGQTYTLSFPLPSEKVVVLGNTISLHTTFSSIGDDASGFTVTRESSLYYLPLQLLVAAAIIFSILSAILIRKLWIKFKK